METSLMLNDIDFSKYEFVSAVKNISICDDTKLVLTTITFIDKKDSVSHLEGLELAFAKNQLEKDKKFIKLAAAYKTVNDVICTDEPIKAIFNAVNNMYRNVTRSESDDIDSVLEDVKFIEMVFDRSDEKHVYM